MSENSTEKERLVAFQKFMIELYERRKKELGIWHYPVQDFAKWLGTAPASTDNWLRGIRFPDLANTIKISSRGGPEVFELTGFDRHIILTDPKLAYIVDVWSILDDEQQQRILAIFSELGGDTKRQ